MFKHFYIINIVLISVVCNAQNTLTKLDSNCVIIPFYGLNNVIIDRTSANELKKIFKLKGSSKTKWKKNYESFLLLGHFVTTFTTVDSSLIFMCFRDKRFFDFNKVKQISIQGNCDCQTVEGIRIGSQYNEIIKVLGEPLLSGVETGLDGTNTIVEYRSKDVTRIITFEAKGNIKKEKFKVERILLR